MASELHTTRQINDSGEQMSPPGHILTSICIFNQSYFAFSDWIHCLSYIMRCVIGERSFWIKTVFVSTNQCCFVRAWLVWSRTKDGLNYWKIQVFFNLLCFSCRKMVKIMWDWKKFRSGTETCAILSGVWCCLLGLFALTSFISRSKTSGNGAYYKLRQNWSTRALFSQDTVNPDSAVNTIPVVVCVRLLTITYAYKLDPQLSNHSHRIFKVSTRSEQVTLVRKRYRQDAASSSPLPLNAFNFSLVWQAPGEHTDIHDPSSPVNVAGFVFVCALGA